jgi:hypothetical protein
MPEDSEYAQLEQAASEEAFAQAVREGRMVPHLRVRGPTYQDAAGYRIVLQQAVWIPGV